MNRRAVLGIPHLRHGHRLGLQRPGRLHVGVGQVLPRRLRHGACHKVLAGQRHQYTFRPDGTYRITIRVSGGYEMVRSEGKAILDRKQVMAPHRLSLNRRESPAEPELFGTWWGQDEEGTFLLLRHVEKGHSLYLRRIEAKETKPPG